MRNVGNDWLEKEKIKNNVIESGLTTTAKITDKGLVKE